MVAAGDMIVCVAAQPQPGGMYDRIRDDPDSALGIDRHRLES